MPTLPPPPVPQQLREMLKDYPEHIDRLQQSLNRLVAKPRHGIGLFEQAIWVLEGDLESFMDEARAELVAAEAGGDDQAIVRAEAKERLMFRARSSNGGMRNLQELRLYFDTHREAFP